MKILFATGYPYLPQRTGGLESSTNDLCIALMERGHEVAVICELSFFDIIWFKNRLISKIKKQKYICDNILPYKVYRGYFDKQSATNILKSFSPDIIVAQIGSAVPFVSLYSEFDIPIIIYQRDVQIQKKYGDNFRINKNISFISNSKFTASKVKKNFGVDSLVLPPMVDARNYLTNNHKGTKALHVGLTPEKGIDLTVELAKRRPDINFLLVESWPISKDKFNIFAELANQHANIEILKRTPDMRDIYKQAKILLVPSMCEEAWGRVVTEAQLNGIPVVSSDRGGLPESVGDGGIVISHKADIGEWEKAIALLMQDEKVYTLYSQKAMDRVRKNDVCKENIIKLFVKHLEMRLDSPKT